MRKLLLLAASMSLAACSGSKSPSGSGSSSGSSGGTGSSGTVDPGCGMVSEQGGCQGNQLTYCITGDLPDGGTGPVTQDCSMYVQNDPDFTCGEVNASYGFDCLANTGTPCAFFDTQFMQDIYLFCQGGEHGGCDAYTGNCVAGATACALLPDGGQPDLACVGTRLVFGCNFVQPVFYDCAELGNGGVCTNASCSNLPAGAPCDTSGHFNCATGHTCTAPTDGGTPFCL